jgi:predicted RNA-binding Zn-ribbon protein involved in translation (DUF1610 family)
MTQERKPRCGALAATRKPDRKPLFASPLQHEQSEEKDAPEEDPVARRQRTCSHANQRGSKYQSRHCPNCGKQLLVDAEEDDADGDSSEARKQKLRAPAARKKAAK